MTGPYDDEPPWEDEPPEDQAEQSTAQRFPNRLFDGATFILDAPDHVPAIWGIGQDVLWADGEALMLTGPAGVGKTTLTGQIVRARLGLGGPVLDLPIRRTSSRVLYLAMDRPRQIARALRRTFHDVDRTLLAERLVVWAGPPIADIARHPSTLVGLCAEVGADTVVIDSLKDAAIGLGEEEVGAGYNRARQLALAEGIQVLELHHMVKRGNGGNRPNTLSDVYGSTWLTAGAGSVVLLWGAAGDPIVDLTHLKQPAAEVGPLRVTHDHEHGESSVWHSTDVLAMAKAAGTRGVEAKAVARALFSTDAPSRAEIEKARRKLDRLVTTGQLDRHDGDKTAQLPAVWTFTGGITPLLPDNTHHDPA